jgi:hypothetical protein
VHSPWEPLFEWIEEVQHLARDQSFGLRPFGPLGHLYGRITVSGMPRPADIDDPKFAGLIDAI